MFNDKISRYNQDTKKRVRCLCPLYLPLSLPCFKYLSSSLDSLVKNLGENGFKHLSQEFDSEALDLVRQKWFHLYEYKCDFEKFLVNFVAKMSFTVH